MSEPAVRKKLKLVLVKPTRYDSDGYPVQWFRSLIPSNSLAVMQSLATDCERRMVLGPDVKIETAAYDEVNIRIPIEDIIKDAKDPSCVVVVGLVGVQTNQFPRSVDLARPLLSNGVHVVVGGFHVSGCIAMLPELPEEIVEAQELGLSIFAGEAEEQRLDEILLDAWNGQLKPLYNHMNDLPTLENQPVPFLQRDAVARTSGGLSSFDLGRGCPYQCSFCAIINVQGRKSRFRSPDDVERIVRQNVEVGTDRFFITDDNFARNKDWSVLFDRLIRLREEERIHIDLMIQVDTLCHKIPGFIEKAVRAGVNKVFVGLENINPANLLEAKKGQNKITEYRAMLQEWHTRGVFIYAGYIVGFANDTRQSILRDVEIVKSELPIDMLEFHILTPLPGSEDHQKMAAAGTWMDPDLNKYNTQFPLVEHPNMSPQEWEEAFRLAWASFYTFDHLETIARRHAARPNGQPKRALNMASEIKLVYEIEDVHPLEGGLLRRKYRTDRRTGMPLENPLVFYAKYVAETVAKGTRFLRAMLKLKAIKTRVLSDPKRLEYTDKAITPVETQEAENLDLYTQTTGGLEAVKRIRRQDEIRQKALERAGG